MKIVSGLLIALLTGAHANASTYRCFVENSEIASVEINFGTQKAAVQKDNQWNFAEQMQIYGHYIPYFTGADANGKSILVVYSSDEQTVTFDVSGQEHILKISCAYSEELESGI